MNQKNLFDPYQVQSMQSSAPLSRITDPVTSHDAAEKLKRSGKLSENERVALALVRLNRGKTGAELDAIAGAKKRQVSKRLAGLKLKGLIVRGQPRICEINESNCVTWWPA